MERLCDPPPEGCFPYKDSVLRVVDTPDLWRQYEATMQAAHEQGLIPVNLPTWPE